MQKENFTSILKILQKILYGIILVGIGMFISTKINFNKVNLHTSKTISVAINEKGELMLIDRKNGNYEIYDENLGKTIFEMYAEKIYYQNLQSK